MNNLEIPTAISTAAVNLLRDYVPGLDSQKLAEALQPKPAETLLTRANASKLLSISVQSLDRMMAAGKIKRVKIGSSIRVPESEVTKIIG